MKWIYFIFQQTQIDEMMKSSGDSSQQMTMLSNELREKNRLVAGAKNLNINLSFGCNLDMSAESRQQISQDGNRYLTAWFSEFLLQASIASEFANTNPQINSTILMVSIGDVLSVVNQSIESTGPTLYKPQLDAYSLMKTHHNTIHIPGQTLPFDLLPLQVNMRHIQQHKLGFNCGPHVSACMFGFVHIVS